MNAFNKIIFDNFKVNIHKFGTLPSLSYAIFLSNFLSSDVKIPIIAGDVYDFIKQGYTGGHTDVFIPKGEKEI